MVELAHHGSTGDPLIPFGDTEPFLKKAVVSPPQVTGEGLACSSFGQAGVSSGWREVPGKALAALLCLQQLGQGHLLSQAPAGAGGKCRACPLLTRPLSCPQKCCEGPCPAERPCPRRPSANTRPRQSCSCYRTTTRDGPSRPGSGRVQPPSPGLGPALVLGFCYFNVHLIGLPFPTRPPRGLL